MNRKMVVVVGVVVVAVAAFFAGAAEPTVAKRAPTRLAVLWTSADPEVAHRVCFMYTQNAKRAKWFDQVQLIIWGPSQKLAVADKDIQAKIKAMMKDGVDVKACISCAKSYGLVEPLRKIGIEVKSMGPPLSKLLQSDWKVITF
jgi:hypothetical protein